MPPKQAPSPVEDLPLVPSLTLQRTSKGWIVVLLQSRGDKIVAKEILGEPQQKAYAIELLKIEVVKRLILETVRA